MGRRRAEAADPSLSLHLYKKREENGGRMNRWRAEAANPPLFPPFARKMKENGGNGPEAVGGRRSHRWWMAGWRGV